MAPKFVSYFWRRSTKNASADELFELCCKASLLDTVACTFAAHFLTCLLQLAADCISLTKGIWRAEGDNGRLRSSFPRGPSGRGAGRRVR